MLHLLPHLRLSRRRSIPALLIIVLGAAACSTKDNPGLDAATAARGGTGAAAGVAGAAPAGENVTGAVAPTGSNWGYPANDGDWTMAAHDYASTRYSPLAEINTANVGMLREAWSFTDGTLHGHEAAPLVSGGTMYYITPFPNIAYALDLTKPGAPIKWTFQPNPSPVAMGKACCDVVNRGGQLADGKLIYNLLDGHTVAVDTATGKEVWRTQVENVENGTTITMAPLIVKDKVLVGNSGGEMGTLGELTALDLKSGKIVWRATSVGPDSLARIGADFKPFYSWMRGKDLGATTWPAGAWKHGAGAPWGWVSYDPDLNLIYYGTSNTGPWNAAQRPGLNLWTSGVFARDPDNGMARWAFVFTPHNEWDYDGVNENVLVNLPIKGQMRKVMVQFNRNGFAYTIDRATGEVLVAAAFGHENWASGIDSVTKMPIVVPEKRTSPPGQWVRDICPADIGVKDEQPTAFSPRTGLFYVPIQNICMDYKGREASYIAGTPYWGADMTRHVGPGGNYGEFAAWDAATGRKVWSIPEKFLVYSGVLVTGGDVAFYGTVDGWFRAVDARSGKVLWSQKLGSGIISSPMTYRAPDGHQYIAVSAGVGGAAMVTAAMPGFPARGGTLYVFALDSAIMPIGETPQAGLQPAGKNGQSPTDKGKR
ncbi:MAG: PQQ-dependent dehydrogenase, methanol/ethanol family [Gemmatimonadaceae bacterium]